MSEFRMPSLGADMEEGTLVEWRVQPGDTVKHGDIIAVVHTEKADIEVEVFEDGVVEKLIAQPGANLPVGSVLAQIRTARGKAEKLAPPKPAPATAEAEPAAQAKPPESAGFPAPTAAAPPTRPARKTARIRVSPLARKMAADLGVDLSTVEGTGPNGAIDSEDVERAAKASATKPAEAPAEAEAPAKAAAATPPAPAMAEAYFGMRRAIAAAMSRANREIPHYYLETRIDVSRALHWMEEENRRRPVEKRLLPVALLLRAAVLALREVPDLNGYWKDDRLQMSEAVHLGFAISLRQGGLIVPAILDAEKKSLDEIMAAMSDLIQRTRAGRLRGREITDGTITVTNLGDRGVEKVFGVIYPPQVALLGLGKITEQPWVHEGGLVVRPVLTASLAGDHRASDGRRGAQFLEAFAKWLQQPEKL